MPTKQNLINAARELLWEVGYESMSPALVLQRSGAGKGSFYHHFTSKENLAHTAIIEIQDELNHLTETILQGSGSPLDRIRKFLLLERQALMGCRLGRLVNERSVIESSLLGPITEYFNRSQALIETVIQQAQAEGELKQSIDSKALSLLILTTIQGGFVLSKAVQDNEILPTIATALDELLNSQKP
ncbi:MAG: AcrR family transcriptional regulator [Paracoccaceae bacterium]|jgi:AcrR family transcriptional regulator